MKRIKFTIFIMTLLLVTPAVYAGLPTAQFLLVGQGPRAEALGQAVVANCFDYTSTYWNPAAINYCKKAELGIDYTDFFQDAEGDGVKNSFLSLIFPYERCGFGLRYISETSGGIKTYDSTGKAGGDELSINNRNLNILFAYQISLPLSIGIGLGTTNMTLPDKSASAINGNLGLIFNQGRLSAGAALANLGGKLKFSDVSSGEDQPLMVRVGIAFKLLSAKNLLVAGSYDKVMKDAKAGGMGLGCEYLPFKYAAFRIGIRKQNDDIIKPSCGLGLKYNFINVDYSFTLAPSELPGTAVHRLGVSFKFSNDLGLGALFQKSENSNLQDSRFEEGLEDEVSEEVQGTE